jgi:hypothetical protein
MNNVVDEEEWEGFDPYAGIRAAMSPEHETLTPHAIADNQGVAPAALALHEFLTSQEMRQALQGTLHPEADRRSIPMNGENVSVPGFLKTVARLCREVADRSEAESDPAGRAVGNFPPGAITAAQAAHVNWKIPASVLLAQWAVEGSWGRALPGSNNPFRVRNGDSFRKFSSLDQAFDHHGRLLATAAPYAHARAFAATPDAFAEALTGVYSPDPRYGSVLKRVMRKCNLYRYD